MCGIFGVLRLDGGAADRSLLERAVAAIAHRGPDGVGYHLDGPLGLAHARLSIIDVSGGAQPMSNEDGSIWVALNGEIFNYVELRRGLEQRGHRFATRSDTEVLVHLYEEEGEAFVAQLNGQWALALWDARRGRLLLSRDRLGVRPLFHARAGRSFVFGSEIKALLPVPGVRSEPDPLALDQLFTFWVTLPPRTFFRGIEELPPGCTLTTDCSGRLEVRPHWRLEPRERGWSSREECAEALLELLRDATRLRLRADVPVGAYLSGGLDSTIIAALVRKAAAGPLRTFSLTFEDPELDERAYQQEAARFLGVDHESVNCTGDDVAAVFPSVVWHAEQPMVRAGPAPLYRLSRLVRDAGFKVVLTGEGADEILGGYDIYKETKIRSFWARRPDSRRRPLLLRRLYPYLPGMKDQPVAYLEQFFGIARDDLASPFFSHLPRWRTTAMVKRFFSEEVKSALAGYDAQAELAAGLPPDYAQWDRFTQAQYLETTLLLPGYILSSQGDRVAMAHAVEGRFPFLDHRVVELAFGIPTVWRMRALQEKYLLKQATRGLVPRAVLLRKKQPYRAPDARSFFGDGGAARADYVDDLLGPQKIREHALFDPPSVAQLVAKARAGRAAGARDNMALVGILSTQLWMEQFNAHAQVRN